MGHVDKWRSQRRIAVFPHWDHRHNFACLNGFSNVVRAIATICQQNAGLGQVVVHDQIEARIVRCLTRRGVRSRGRARTVDAEVDLGRETTTRTAETLSRSPPFCAGCPMMGANYPRRFARTGGETCAGAACFIGPWQADRENAAGVTSCWRAQHRQWPDIHRFRHKPIKLREQRLQVGHRKMSVQRGPVGPVFIEHKHAGVGGIDVVIVVDAAGFRAGWGHLGHQKPLQFGAGFGASGDSADDRVHVRPSSG